MNKKMVLSMVLALIGLCSSQESMSSMSMVCVPKSCSQEAVTDMSTQQMPEIAIYDCQYENPTPLYGICVTDYQYDTSDGYRCFVKSQNTQTSTTTKFGSIPLSLIHNTYECTPKASAPWPMTPAVTAQQFAQQWASSSYQIFSDCSQTSQWTTAAATNFVNSLPSSSQNMLSQINAYKNSNAKLSFKQCSGRASIPQINPTGTALQSVASVVNPSVPAQSTPAPVVVVAPKPAAPAPAPAAATATNCLSSNTPTVFQSTCENWKANHPSMACPAFCQ